MKHLYQGSHVDFVLIILKCELLHCLNLQFRNDFVVETELKPVHCQDYHIEFLYLNRTSLILYYFAYVLLCFCVCHVARMY